MQVWTGEGYGPSLESGASEGKTGRAGPEYPAAGRYGGSGAYGLLEASGIPGRITPRIQRAALAAEVYYPVSLLSRPGGCAGRPDPRPAFCGEFQRSV